MSDTSKSASSIHTIVNKQYHFMTSSDRFPVPVNCGSVSAEMLSHFQCASMFIQLQILSSQIISELKSVNRLEYCLACIIQFLCLSCSSYRPPETLCFRPVRLSVRACVGVGDAELSVGPFCVTRSNPTHQLTDPTQPNPLEVEKFGPNPTQPNTTNKFNCLMQPNLV